MLKLTNLKKTVFILIGILLCDGCLQPVESDIKTDKPESSTAIITTTSPDKIAIKYSEQDKLSKTRGYLLYDETKECASITLYLKGVSEYKEYDSVKCYLNQNIVTEKTEIKKDIQDYVLSFDIKEYIEKFNRIQITSGEYTETIDIGTYELERIYEDSIPDKNKLELISFENSDMINEFDGTFQIDGNLSKYDIEYYIPKQIQKMKMLNIQSDNEEGNFSFHCDCSRDDFKQNDLYSVEFDMYVMQVDKNTGDMRIICKCFIPLTAF
ncbi:MAG: hypothetical protein HFJ09_11685 [Lachnospiraceae bacterium]|nr:hypothetical protein [Lachnospiraceae bacterium]